MSEEQDIADIAEDLAEITMDFLENHNISLSEFDGLMLGQIVRNYRDAGCLEELEALLAHVQESIEEIKATKSGLH